MSNQRPSSHGLDGISFASVLRECLAGGMMVIDADSEIMTITPRAELLLGLQASGPLNHSFKLLPAPLQARVRETLEAGTPTAETQFVLRPGETDEKLVRAAVVPLKTGQARSGVVVVLNNVTPAERLERHLQRVDRLASIGTLSASMAHEVKNALVAVRTFVDLLLEKNRDAELAEVVSREMRRIDSLVGQMLRYAGPARPAFSVVRVHDVLDHSLRLVQPQIEGRLISLSRAFNATPDVIKGDEYQLEQTFVNLLLNAIEAMGTNGSLTLTTDLVPALSAHPKAAGASGAHVRVVIADTGMGITTENLNRLFEPFFTTKEQGTGLGLTIARRIVQEHHGDLSVQSEVNKGTTCRILLPAHAMSP